MRIFIFKEQRFQTAFSSDGTFLSLGKSEDCAFCVKDSHLASKHCEFIRVEGGYLLKNLVYKVKPVVNETPCSSQVGLPLGSKIRINVKEEIEIFYNPKCRLVIDSEWLFSKHFSLFGSRHSLGSAEFCDLLLDSQEVAKRHCEFILRGKSYWVSQVAHDAKIYLNGARVREAKLKSDDILSIGGHKLKVFDFDPELEESICHLDDSWHLGSETCGSCAKGGFLSACKIYGRAPKHVWNDEISCPDREPIEVESKA